jgi:hypothetical protein
MAKSPPRRAGESVVQVRRQSLGLAGEEGGYRTKGRTAEERSFSVNEARVTEENAEFALVLELVDPSAAAEITQSGSIPTIGIGSGWRRFLFPVARGRAIVLCGGMTPGGFC